MRDERFDDDGFLKDLRRWDRSIAEQIAEAEGLVLTEIHWQLIDLARDFYRRFDHAPNMRPLVKLVREELDPELGDSIALMRLFSDQPAKQLAKLAGLPKPSRCL